jgi:hypothetical protein
MHSHQIFEGGSMPHEQGNFHAITLGIQRLSEEVHLRG